MGLKVMNVIFLALLFVVVNTTPIPRDSNVAKIEPVVNVHDEFPVKHANVESPECRNEVHIPGRVYCRYEETTEDPVCQEHCFPKGYKYGLCVRGICSCV